MVPEGAVYDRAYWLRIVSVGIWFTLIVIVAVMAYLALTPQGPSRGPLLGMLAVVCAGTLVLRVLPWARILEHRSWAIALYTWSTILTIATAAIVALDGGLDSPLAFTFVLPLIFAAMAYPVAGLVLVTTGGMIALAVVHAIAGGSVGGLFYMVCVEALAGGMCGLIADNHRRSYIKETRLKLQLEELARVDGLSGCLNHRSFQEELRREVARAHRDGSPLALAVLDLDRFKEINDTHGHLAGDDVLAAVGSRLRAVARATDIVARTGGEEFAVLIPGAGAADAPAVGQGLRDAIGAIRQPLAITVSVGISVLPDLAADAEALLQQADAALYTAKRYGRDQVVVHGTGLRNRHGERDARAQRISALLHGGLAAYYQPIVDLLSGEVLGYEALARMPGSHQPITRWLQLADEVGLRVELEAAMWDAALAGWPRDIAEPLYLNVGINALRSGALLRLLPHLPVGAVIELSEREPVASYAELLSVLEEWREAGVRVAVDDLGAGHSSLRHVTMLDPDIVKIDRALVAGLHRNRARKALVAGLTGFAEETGAQLIAEGVEEEDEADALLAAGVSRAQGFLLGRPAPLAAPVLWRPRGATAARS